MEDMCFMKAIINGKIILKDLIVEGKVLVYDSVIRGVCDNAPEGAEIIDAKGGYVAPGLIDLHIHGYLGKDVCDASDPEFADQLKVTDGLLQDLGASGKPVLFVFNKCDLCTDRERLTEMRRIAAENGWL
jgi:predicted amidohydrolase